MKFARLRLALLWLWHQLLTLSLAGVVLLVGWVVLGRELMPLVANYKGSLEVKLSHRVGVPVTIASLRGGWEGLQPYFVAEGISLHDPLKPSRILLQLHAVTTRPALWPTLLHGEPRLITTMDGLSLHIRERSDGQFQIDELAQLASSDAAAARQTTSLLLRQPFLALESSYIELSLQGQAPLVMRQLSLHSFNQGNQHWLQGQFTVPGARHNVQLSAHFHADSEAWDQGDMLVYLNSPALVLDDWVARLGIPELGIVRARAGGEYWVDIQQGSLQAITGRLQVAESHLHMQMAGQTSDVTVKHLSGLLQLARDHGEWVFSANSLTGEINGQPLPAPRFAMRIRSEGVELTSAQVALGPLRALAEDTVLLPMPMRHWLQATALTGWVPHVRITMARTSDGHLGLPKINAEFKALSLASYKGQPGFANAAGWLSLGAAGGELFLDSRDVTVTLPTVLHQPVLADSLTGGVRIRHEDGHWLLISGPLQVVNSDVRGSTILSVDIPERDPFATELHLLAQLRDAKATEAWRYTPWSSAGEDAIAWMKRAFTGGTISHAEILFDGPVNTRKDLPDSQLQMHFALQDGTLDFQPGWPALTGLQADVVIDNNRLEVSSPAAAVLNTQATSVAASIPDLNHPIVLIDAQLQGPASDVPRLFRESPLRENLGPVAEELQLNGALAGRLQLKVPLDDRPTAVSVSTHLDGNGVRLKTSGLVFEKLAGDLRYSDAAGLQAEELDARLFGADTTIVIGSQVRGDALREVHIALDGHASVPALQKWSDATIWRFLDGDADFHADVSIPTDDRPTQLTVTSLTEGMRINLPPPVGKGAEAMPMRYQADFGKGRTSARLVLGHQHLAVGMALDNGRVQSVLARVDGGPVSLPDAAGVVIDAHFSRLNLADWQRWWMVNSKNLTGGSGLPLSRVSVDARDLQAAGYVLHGAHLDATSDDDGWSVRIDSDHLSGDINIPLPADLHTGIGIALDKLDWPLPTAPGPGNDNVAVPAELQGIPLLLHISQLNLGDWPQLGASSLSAHLLPGYNGLSVSPLDITNSGSGASFRGSLSWQQQTSVQTQIDGTLQGSDVAQLLTRLGMASPPISTARFRQEIRFGWPGSPADFALARLNGHFATQGCKGDLPHVGLVTSASRLLGLFDPHNIKRRLHLDVTDVTRKGVSFDAVAASGDLHGGVISNARFALRGPSMNVDGKGLIDLNQHTLDQDINVRLPLASGALPAAVAFTVNPVAGAVVVALDVLGGKAISNLTALHYHVGGDWEDPQVQLGPPGKPEPAADKAKADAKSLKEIAPLCTEPT